MDSVITAYRPQVGQDSVGGTTSTFLPVAGCIAQPCCTHQSSNSEGQVYDQNETLIKGEVFLLTALPIQMNDRVSIANNGTGAITNYNIRAGTRQQSNVRNRLWSIEVEAIL